jgi:RNA polymerase sigma factor (sigma-70 family)
MVSTRPARVLLHPRPSPRATTPPRRGVEEPSTDGETALMARFRDRRGAEEFQALYEFTRGDLLTWICALVRGRRLTQDPLDLLQDTFVNIYRYAGGFRDERGSSFRVWSRKIATNVVRRAATRGREWKLQDFPEGLAEPADGRAGPGEVLARSEEARSLVRAWMLLLGHYACAVEKLRDRDRRALELVEVEGYSYAAAAAELKVGPSNMKMIVFRARKRIRAEVGRTLALPEERPLRAAS